MRFRIIISITVVAVLAFMMIVFGSGEASNTSQPTGSFDLGK